MDKETLSNYGWIVICVLVLAVMLALATPFGTFVADGFKATYTGLFDTGDSALDVGLNAVGVKNTLECGHGRKESGDHTQKECGHYACDDSCSCVPAACGIDGHWSGDGKDHATTVNHTDHTYACQCNGWVVPEGGTYSGMCGTKTAGQQLPCGYTPTSNDKYITEEYEYRYNLRRNSSGWYAPGNGPYWLVAYIGTSNAPGAILSDIAGKPVQSMEYAFYKNTNITDLSNLVIPETITIMNHTFSGCTGLIDLDGFVIPGSVSSMGATFSGCTSLVDASGLIIKDGPHNMSDFFYNCYALELAPFIPDQTKGVHLAFTGPHLKEPVQIPCTARDDCGTDNVVYYHSSICNGTCGK